MLFAFLLTVPFSNGFAKTTPFQRDLFFATLCATAVSAALLIAPSAWHRLHFRQKDKERILLVSNRLSLAGLAFLALSMVGAVMMVADFVFSPTVTVIAGVAATGLIGALWAALPLLTRPGVAAD